MSLLRLLTAGKSLVGLKKDGKQYRDLGPGALPRFEGKKGLFQSGRQAWSGQKDVISSPVPSQQTDTCSPAAPQEKLFQSSQPESSRSKWGWPWRKRAAVPRFDKAPVQAELSLDRVKVIRNDLTDSDLEIVPASRAAAKPSEARQTAKAADSAKPGEAVICP